MSIRLCLSRNTPTHFSYLRWVAPQEGSATRVVFGSTGRSGILQRRFWGGRSRRLGHRNCQWTPDAWVGAQISCGFTFFLVDLNSIFLFVGKCSLLISV